ncbi:MAG TPA: hypothetical protein VII45_12650 [Solirubrobacterales bacterium]
MPNQPRLTYSNVVSTLALFLALSGGVAFAASKIQSGDIAHDAVKAANIAPGAVRTAAVFKRAIASGKLAVGAVRSNQIADGAVSAQQIADGTVGSKQIGAASVAPSNLQFPVFFVASPLGDTTAIPSGEPVAYPLNDSIWTQKPGQLNVIFGGALATIAYDGEGSGSCRVFFEVNLNGQQVGGGEVSTGSTTLQQVEQSIGAQPEIDPTVAVNNRLAARIGSNGDCTPDSAVDSTRFRVLDFG